MKKEKIKLLTLTLILAMLISLVPVSILQAANPKLKVSKVYLYNGREGKNTYKLKVNNTLKGYKFKWKSEDKKVAKVNSKGNVTAVGVGTTKVSVKITDSKGKNVKTLKATIIVRDIIKKVTINNPISTLKLNESYDFNIKYATESKSSNKTSSVIKWTVEQKGTLVANTKAAIDKDGIFIAKEVGQYEVVARAFQSEAKYKQWLNDKVKYKKNVNASDSITVKIIVPKAEIISFRQPSKSSISIEFSQDMRSSGIDKLNTIYRVYTGSEISTTLEKIKTVSFDSTGKTVTLYFNYNFDEKTKYRFKFEDLSYDFEPVRPEVRSIKSLRFTENPINVIVENYKPIDLNKIINAYDQNGNLLYTGEQIKGKLTYSLVGDYIDGYVDKNLLYIYKTGTYYTVKAEYKDYVYDESRNEYTEIKFEAETKALGKELDKSIVQGSTGFKIQSSSTSPNPNDNTGWGKSFTVAKGESSNIFARNRVAHISGYQLVNYDYESTDTDKAIIFGTSIYFVSSGTVDIIAREKNGTGIEFITFNIRGERGLESINAVTGLQVNLSNSTVIKDTGRIRVVAKDNLNQPISGVEAIINLKNSPTISAGDIIPIVTPMKSDSNGEIQFTITASGAKVGLYVYEVEYRSGGKSIKGNISVLVADGTQESKPVRWSLDIPSEVDLKNNINATITIKVYGYNTKGAKVEELVYGHNTKGYKLVVRKADQIITNGINNNIITGSQIGVGTYNIAIFAEGNNHISDRPDGTHLIASNLTIKDTNVKRVEERAIKVSSGTQRSVINAAFKFILNGYEVNVTNASQFFAEINGPFPIVGDKVTAGQYYIDKVTINNITYTVGKTITVE